MLFGHVYHVCVCCLHLPSDSKARTQVEFPEMAPKRRRRASRRKAAPKKGRRVGGSGIVQGDFSVLDVVVSIFHRSSKKNGDGNFTWWVRGIVSVLLSASRSQGEAPQQQEEGRPQAPPLAPPPSLQEGR